GYEWPLGICELAMQFHSGIVRCELLGLDRIVVRLIDCYLFSQAGTSIGKQHTPPRMIRNTLSCVTRGFGEFYGTLLAVASIEGVTMSLRQQQWPWFAIFVKTCGEKNTSSLLGNAGFECFLPTCKSVRRWSDRSKVLEVPLFPGYLFCR